MSEEVERRKESARHTDRAGQLRLILGIVSLAIYALLSLLHHQSSDGDPQWIAYGLERPFMASAVSHFAYGAPIAAVYGGVYQAFVHPSESLGALLNAGQRKSIEPGGLRLLTEDGIGPGEIIFVTAAMRIFGLHTSSLVWAFLSLISVATAAFLLRFRDHRVIGLIAVLSALAAMFASQLGTTVANVASFPVGGYRYFSLLAAIPGIHIFLELIDHDKILTRQWIKNSILLFIQLGIFAIAIYVNLAAIYLYGLFAFGIAYVALHNRTTGQLCKALIVIGVSGAALVAAKDLYPQVYRQAGRNGDTVWARIFVSMGVSPHWPFGTLADEYRGCWPGAPTRSLEPGLGDFNWACAWSHYTERHHISPHQMAEELFDRNFNAVLRADFFRIARRYPKETLLTFVYYKPLLLCKTLLSLFDFPGHLPGWEWLLIGLQFLVLFALALLDRNAF